PCPAPDSASRSGLLLRLLELVADAGLAEQAAGALDIVGRHQDPPRQDAERALDDAHVLVGDEVADPRLLEQGLDERDQHDVVGPQDLVHRVLARVGSYRYRCRGARGNRKMATGALRPPAGRRFPVGAHAAFRRCRSLVPGESPPYGATDRNDRSITGWVWSSHWTREIGRAACRERRVW